MSRKTLALVHTSSTLVPVFERLCKEKKLDVNLVHISDSSLIEDVIQQGSLNEETSQRVIDHLTTADENQADCIMVTCSSIGPAVDAARSRFKKPVLRVDQPLADHAIRLGDRIGVVATLSTTLVPTADLIQRRAKEIGKDVKIVSHLCDGAFQALIDEDFQRHDAAVAEAIQQLAEKVDVIVLAQASMARVVIGIDPDKIGVPILSSPSLAVDFLATVL